MVLVFFFFFTTLKVFLEGPWESFSKLISPLKHHTAATYPIAIDQLRVGEPTSCNHHLKPTSLYVHHNSSQCCRGRSASGNENEVDFNSKFLSCAAWAPLPYNLPSFGACMAAGLTIPLPCLCGTWKLRPQLFSMWRGNEPDGRVHVSLLLTTSESVSTVHLAWLTSRRCDAARATARVVESCGRRPLYTFASLTVRPAGLWEAGLKVYIVCAFANACEKSYLIAMVNLA